MALLPLLRQMLMLSAVMPMNAFFSQSPTKRNSSTLFVNRFGLNTLCGNARGLQSFDGLGLRTFLIAINGLKCSKSALICSSLLPESTRSTWHQLQLLVAQLLYQLKTTINLRLKKISKTALKGMFCHSKTDRISELCFSQALPLQWNPPWHTH